MYQPGQLIVYGAEGVCRVAAVGPLSMRDAQDGVNYYTLSPLYRSGTIYVPVDAALHTRPVMSREDAQRLIAHIPDVAPKLCESNNPRLLNEHYQALLKSDDCVDRVRLIRAVYAKGRAAAKKGKRLGQVDERSMKRAEDILHGELDVALNIPVDGVKDYISNVLNGSQAS